MTYAQTIDYLYKTLPMFSHMGSAAYKKDLTNTIELCRRLGQPQNKFRTIHVAGTNGKGSVSHMLASIFQSAGYKTGLYTSPHLYDFRERIRINGMMADEDFVVQFVEKIRPAIMEIQPSFFEITVAMAFDYFASRQVDIAVIETGLGGRLDSTNIITPEVSVITNIGWDHMNILGNTIPEIAREKAGIIKPGVPAVIGEKTNETTPVFVQAAQENRAPLFFAGDRFSVVDYKLDENFLSISVHDKELDKITTYTPELTGFYQAKNVVTVLQAVALLNKWNISEENIQSGLQHVRRLTGLQGRWEMIHRHPDVILDVAHNREGILQVLQHLEKLNYENLHIVIGMVKDKEVSMVLELLPREAHYYFTQSHIPRAMDAVVLKEMARTYSLHGETWPDANEALHAAMQQAGDKDLVLVCGSIFLVAEVNIQSVSQQA